MDADLVLDALRTVREPEIGADIVSLGLVYDIRVTPEHIRVVVTMTSRRAPHAVIVDAIERVLWRPGGPTVDIEVVWEPRWSPAMITPEGLKALGRPVFR